jgi:hypothetical protein
MPLLYSALSMSAITNKADNSIECLMRDGLNYEIRADNPARSTWDFHEVIRYAKELMHEGTDALESLAQSIGTTIWQEPSFTSDVQPKTSLPGISGVGEHPQNLLTEKSPLFGERS